MDARWIVVKFNKRLWVKDTLEDKLIYTPPMWINVVSRHCLDRVANDMNNGMKYIDAVVAFESTARRKKGFR